MQGALVESEMVAAGAFATTATAGLELSDVE